MDASKMDRWTVQYSRYLGWAGATRRGQTTIIGPAVERLLRLTDCTDCDERIVRVSEEFAGESIRDEII